MDVLSLARFQFAMTTVFHFFFVPFSIGTIFVVAIMESIYVHTGNPEYKKMTKFWANIFLLSFAVGVVTGIIQEFQFGMNWSDYSRFMGDIFGAPLAFEALLSFFIESTFIGLWLFTWNRVKKGLHLFFAWMVVFGSMTSALWILTANSFMQHPVGYAIRNTPMGKRAEMVNFGALLQNPQLWYEYGHVIIGALLTGATILTGLAAFQLLKKRTISDASKKIYHKTMRLGMILMLIFSLGEIVVGDMQMQFTIKDQPMKFAATEAVYKTTGERAPWTVVAVANPKTHEVKGIDIPDMLSILSYHKTTGSVKGMEEVNADLHKQYDKQFGKDINYYVPVNTLFWTFRVMCGFAALLFLMSLIGLIMTRKGKEHLYQHRWLLWIFGLLTFSPFLANTSGWLITELGRMPWTVYGLFTIKDSVSPSVSANSLLFSNIVYFCLFTILAIVMIALVVRFLRNDPEEYAAAGQASKSTDPFAKEAF